MKGGRLFAVSIGACTPCNVAQRSVISYLFQCVAGGVGMSYLDILQHCAERLDTLDEQAGK